MAGARAMSVHRQAPTGAQPLIARHTLAHLESTA